MKHSEAKHSQKHPEGTPERQFEQYRQARRDGHVVTRALLGLKFKTGIRDVSAFEETIQEYLTKEPATIAPWRSSPLTQSPCRDGIRLAALELYWEHRSDIQFLLLSHSILEEIDDLRRASIEMPHQSDDYWCGRCEQIKARIDALCRRYPDFAQAFSEYRIEYLTFGSATQIQ